MCHDDTICQVSWELMRLSLTLFPSPCDSVDPTRLLLTFNVSINLGDKYHKNTALHWAVLAGNTTVISLLLDANANVDAQNIKVVAVSWSTVYQWCHIHTRTNECIHNQSAFLFIMDVTDLFSVVFQGWNTVRSRQAKEECLDDQSLTGSAAGQRLRQPVIPEETEDGQGVCTQNTHTVTLHYTLKEKQRKS